MTWFAHSAIFMFDSHTVISVFLPSESSVLQPQDRISNECAVYFPNVLGCVCWNPLLVWLRCLFESMKENQIIGILAFFRTAEIKIRIWMLVIKRCCLDSPSECLHTVGFLKKKKQNYLLHLSHKFQHFLKPCSAHSQSVQSLSCVQLFANPWTAACQASLPIHQPLTVLDGYYVLGAVRDSVCGL